MFLCVWVCVCYVVGEGLRLCNLETSPVSSILQWFARCGYLVSSMLQMWMWVPCLMMIETETYWLRLALLQRHIYGLKGRNIDVFAENSSLAINPHYIQSWLDLLSRTPRVAPFLQKNDPFIAALKKVWTVPTNDFISLTRFPVFLRTMTLVFWCRNYLNTLLMYMFKMMPLMACSIPLLSCFWDITKLMLPHTNSKKEKKKMLPHTTIVSLTTQVASVTFDLLFLLVLGSYLIVLFCFLVITTRVWIISLHALLWI